MGISLGGINTGLPPNLVEQLIEAERVPIHNTEARKGKSKARLDLVNKLEESVRKIQGTVKELAGTGGFADIKLISGDPNVIGGTVDPGSHAKGSWNIEVMSLANKAAALSNGFPDKDRTELGVGYFEFDTADGTKEVYINGSNNTLQGAADAINRSGVGLRATVIKDSKFPDAPYRLMCSSQNTGDTQNVSFPRLYFLDGDQDFYFEEKRESANGKVKIDGIEFEISDNTLKDLIPGVNLEIRQASPGRSVNVSVKEDREVVSGKIKSFVDAINEVLSFTQAQNKMTADTDTSKTLGGDSLLRTVENDFRRLIQNPQFGVGGEIKYLYQIGIAFNRNGTLEFDEKKFNSTLANQPEAVQSFFVGDGFTTGFIPALRRTVGQLVDGSFGIVVQRKRGLEQKIQQADQRIDQMERTLQRKEQSIRRQFAKLEETMSRMKSQGSALAARLGDTGGGLGSLNLGTVSKTGNGV